MTPLGTIIFGEVGGGSDGEDCLLGLVYKEDGAVTLYDTDRRIGFRYRPGRLYYSQAEEFQRFVVLPAEWV